MPASILSVLCIAWLTLSGLLCIAAESRAVNFDRDIRPVLADKCLACHGSDAKHREGNLRLDQQEAATRGGDSELAAIVPRHPEQSELIRRICSDDATEQMPPPHSKKKLTAAERELLTRWIAQGGEYQKHWAFQTPVLPPIPEVQHPKWVVNAIDCFVLARLEEERLEPSSPADRNTLIRRMTLDLTGLPPSLEELDRFLQDREPGAFERAVERLLDSPQYGERWGRMWLDGARYADSDGYEKDKPRFVWPYRDWVVQAFNRDLPYNQFVIEQLAGDLLPDATQDQLVATGFLRNSMLNEEGGVDPEQFRMEAMFDRMDAIGKSILGLTVNCCQCHDHKYDPISQQEYYQLFAFFNNTQEGSVAAYTPQQQMLRSRVGTEIHAIEKELQGNHPDWSQQMANWEQGIPEPSIPWNLVAPKQVVSGDEKHYVLKDGSILAQGYAPTKSSPSFEVTTSLEMVRAVKLELLNHPDLPLRGPGRAVDGTGALTDFQVAVAPADGSAGFTDVVVAAATADINPPKKPLAPQFGDRTNRRRVTGPIELAIDGNKDTAWGINIGPERSNAPWTAVFELKDPPKFPGGMKLRFTLVQNHGGWNSNDNQSNNLGCFRFHVTDDEGAHADAVPVPIRQILNMPPESRSFAQQQTLFSYWRTTVKEFALANQKIEELQERLPWPTTQPSLVSRDEMRPSFVLAKGNFLQPTEPVVPGVPAVLHPFHVENPTRLDLARWLVDEKSPTVARSIVNRVWQTYFGTGLVSTSDDFGLQGDYPSHPELLDWLAVDFMQHGWSLKRLHRMIIRSATYSQSSQISPELLSHDPDNRLLARGTRFRMEAEGVRDISLAVSGLINLELGGPPVCPPCPEFLLRSPFSYGQKSWPLAEGSQRYRRALYTFRFRSVPYPALQMFDAPVGEASCVRRVKSNTPLQALATLNEPVFVDCARNLSKVVLKLEDCPDEERIRLAFRRCTCRTPNPREQQVLMAFLQNQRQRLAQGELEAKAIVLNEEALSQDMSEEKIRERAAWIALCRVLLNLDETMTRE